jgi:hypothetical protein
MVIWYVWYWCVLVTHDYTVYKYWQWFIVCYIALTQFLVDSVVMVSLLGCRLRGSASWKVLGISLSHRLMWKHHLQQFLDFCGCTWLLGIDAHHLSDNIFFTVIAWFWDSEASGVQASCHSAIKYEAYSY